MSCQRTVEMGIVANLKGKTKEDKECQWVTKYKNNGRDISNIKGCIPL